MRIIDTERDIETLRTENTSLKYRLNQYVSDKDSAEKVVQHLQFEKAEKELRVEELERENRILKEEVSLMKASSFGLKRLSIGRTSFMVVAVGDLQNGTKTAGADAHERQGTTEN